MKFHKGIFVIRMIDEAKTPIDYVSGWIEDTNTYGFYKNKTGKFWIATDLCSGMRICSNSTRKKCVEWIEENSKKIQERKLEKSYLERVHEFEALLKEELKKTNENNSES